MVCVKFKDAPFSGEWHGIRAESVSNFKAIPCRPCGLVDSELVDLKGAGDA